jgi:hypothetical protein
VNNINRKKRPAAPANPAILLPVLTDSHQAKENPRNNMVKRARIDTRKMTITMAMVREMVLMP